jgi:carboxyl-terminal processing protease
MPEPPNRSKSPSHHVPRGRLRLLLVASLALLAGVLLQREVLSPLFFSSAIPPRARSDFRLMAQAWNTIEHVYVDRAAVQPRPMTYGAIGGMVDALGDTGHSRFLSPKMAKLEQDYSEGRLIGIGAELRVRAGHVVVLAPLDGSPAQHAGLRPGDIILKVDGKDATGLPLGEVVEHITGPAGTQVTLTIRDPASDVQRDVTLRRARITLHNVTWQHLPDSTLAHLRLAAFSKGVSDGLRAVLSEIQGQALTGIILDLRNNAGGLLDEAVSTASEFLPGGNVLLEKNAGGEIAKIPVARTVEETTLPLAVLVNSGTASAAEIVAGALQDAHRGVLVGQTTFGTGTVLGQFRLSDGSMLLLAVEEWLTPTGHTIWHKGIQPDVVAPLPEGVGPLLPAAERDMTAAQIRSSRDTQLLRAMDLLALGKGARAAPPAKASRD